MFWFRTGASAAMSSSTPGNSRDIIIPGQQLELEGRRPGFGTYRKEGRAFSSTLGLKVSKGNYVDILPLSGKYIPLPGDEVIGTVSDMTSSNWLFDINSPYPGVLHVSESPWKVEFGATAKYLELGDNVTARILSVDDSKHVQLTMRDQSLRKLKGGHVVDVPYAKVPRVIGKSGSMIEMLKEYSGCKILVGKNGRIWIDGEVERIVVVAKAIGIIDEGAHTHGLTDKVREYLEESLPSRRN